MRLLTNIFLFIWTFPFPLMRFINAKNFVGKWKENKTYIYRWWLFDRRFSFASYPDIFISHSAKLYNRELMFHEQRHLQQQKIFGGVIFLLTYALFFVILLLLKKFSWFDAYYAIPWEIDARKWAKKKVSE